MRRAERHRSYQFALLDSAAKRELRRAVLKAIAIPGFQVPYASRELAIARGFGTGALQVTLALIGPDDCLKVIDQGSDDSVNAANLREFILALCPGVRTTTRTQEATLIQSRHRIPERGLNADQILILQVPYPDPLALIEANEERRRRMHANADYARLYVKLYEDLVRLGEISISHRYPTLIHARYIIDPSPIPRFDLPKLNHSHSLVLFAAGREKKIYAVPPYAGAEPLAFDDVPFRVEAQIGPNGDRIACAQCGSKSSFLEQSEAGGAWSFQCSDTDYCDQMRDIAK